MQRYECFLKIKTPANVFYQQEFFAVIAGLTRNLV